MKVSLVKMKAEAYTIDISLPFYFKKVTDDDEHEVETYYCITESRFLKIEKRVSAGELITFSIHKRNIQLNDRARVLLAVILKVEEFEEDMSIEEDEFHSIVKEMGAYFTASVASVGM